MTGAARTYALRRQLAQETGISDEEFWAAQAPILTRAMASGDYPAIAQLPEYAFTIDGDEALEFGLTPLLGGLEAFIKARTP
ncbi:MAG: TetR/AcrR family transcriptional regulator C-terminal domain-containing protein [Pseudonocardiaceae bacterium]